MTDGSAPGDPAPRPTAGRRRAPRSARTRWLAAGGVAALATVLGLSLALRSGAAPACAAPLASAAPPAGGTVHKGKATFYDSKGAGGNCSYPSAPANRRYVALGPSEYAAGAACGGFLDVTGPRGTVRVLVMDQCPECEPGHLDLSREGFAEIADPVQGVVGISYRAVVDPPLPGPLTFRIKEGASQWWFAVLVGQHGNPLRSVEVRQGSSGAWRDAAGLHRMAPGQVQRSTVRMYGGAAPARATTPARSPSARPSRTASPSVSASPSLAAAASPPAVLDAAVAPVDPTRAAGCGN
ncbi:expansin EXLX1 family cellulose-binding protein [Micromonospora sp. L32]|uniref:expansin EXLX1 family cellulose-binding protein n=1 Tax=Micromonospora sp. L32 TaxID=3452214 RepID=UPI003F8C3EA1